MKKLIIILLTTVSCYSCKKEIDVDLKNADQQIVIEGIINNVSPAEVYISKSVTFTDRNTFPPVSGATVKITDNNSIAFVLTETASGTYSNSALVGIPGHTYNLSVMTGAKLYLAASTMPLQVNLDTILLEKTSLGNKFAWIVKPQYADPPGFGNCYKFYETINNSLYPSCWVWDDRLTNNGVSTRPLIQSDSTINISDTVEVEMQCIDRNVFRYFTSLLDVQQNNTVPANPESNISGGCLGYFSAQTTQKKKVLVK